jgi:hypothetical protein
MKIIRLLPAFLLIAFCTSCVPLASLYPLWDEDQVAELPGLVGTWTEKDSDTLTFSKATDAAYKLTFTSGKELSRYEVHAVELDGRFYLDFFPDMDELGKLLEHEAYLALVPAHFFGNVILDGNSLKLALLDDDKVGKKFGDHAIPLLKLKDGLLLTAETKEIQKLMIGFADDAELWGETSVFVRK